MTTLPGPLVDSTWLAANLEDVIVADCRWVLDKPDAGQAAHEVGHIPGAIYVSLDDHLSDMTVPNAGRHPLPTRARFARTLGSLGISDDRIVVVYDDVSGAYASRMWWMLRWVGHEDVAILDGGFPAWTAAHPTESGTVTLPAAEFAVGSETMPVVARTDVQAAGSGTLIFDARSGERFRGEAKSIDPADGHIPGAANAPYADNLVDGVFLGAGALEKRFNDMGVENAADAVIYCGSGVTACHDIFAMEMAGLGTAALYPGSWSEWSSAGLPVATGPE
jgi:thiosulfate/3-mercaptopyruvate sulfurtransferase